MPESIVKAAVIMSTTIYLIRHGETAGNAEVRYIGRTDIPLDAKGVVQAQELCYKLQQYAIEEIYASPLQRAIATAAPIAEVLRKQIHIENGLKEINCGAWETLTAKQVCEKWPKELDNWANHPDKLKIPEGDSFADVQKRMISALGAIARANEGKNVAVVSHMGAILTVGCYLTNTPIRDLWSLGQPGNTSISKIVYDDNLNPRLIGWADESYLPISLQSSAQVVAGFEGHQTTEKAI